MPELNLTNVPDADEYAPVPVGKYLCKIGDINAGLTTQNGDEMWGITLEVADGPLSGKQIRDNISFGNETALKRVKLICSRVGLDVSRKLNLQPEMLSGKFVNVEVDGIREYIDKKGRPRKAAQVAFAGYEMATREQAVAAREADPFSGEGNIIDLEDPF